MGVDCCCCACRSAADRRRVRLLAALLCSTKAAQNICVVVWPKKGKATKKCSSVLPLIRWKIEAGKRIILLCCGQDGEKVCSVSFPKEFIVYQVHHTYQ